MQIAAARTTPSSSSSAAAPRLAPGRALSAEQFDAFMKRGSSTLRLLPGRTLTFSLPSRTQLSSLKGLAKGSAFSISTSRDMPTSRIVISVKEGATAGRKDALKLETWSLESGAMVRRGATPFTLQVG